ncbi:NAC domain-containing protein 48-like [Cornus florida]|uniref:NAC domain-containing protein 48-like n=1 Tax=Cornus florida TaxID=4283 RepID=UPI00289B9570|nr:NAC domain-containing protein 48-like [Cornus florida]
MFLIPLGFHFDPTKVEIIHYLSRKVKGESMPEGIILDIDLYDKAPWDILKKEDPWHTSSKNNCQFIIYVFTKLKKIGNKKRVVRRAGCGTWNGQNKPKEIYNKHKQLIGSKKMLAFEANIKKDEWSVMPGGHWTMHEYSLGGVSLDGLEEGNDQDYVICKIKRDDSKFLRRAPKHAGEVSKEESPSQKKKMRYDHDEASASTPPQKTPLATSSDFQPLPAYYDETTRLFDMPNINCCGTIEGLHQIDSFF